MSDVVTTTADVAGTTGNIPVGNPAPTTGNTPAPQQQEQPTDPAWLAGRLDRAKRELVKTLGFESEDDLKAALGEQAKRKQKEQSELEKLSGTINEWKPKVDQFEAYAAYFTELATEEISSLSDEQKATVEEVTGLITDPVARLKAVRKLKATLSSSKQKPPAPNINAGEGVTGEKKNPVLLDQDIRKLFKIR